MCQCLVFACRSEEIKTNDSMQIAPVKASDGNAIQTHIVLAKSTSIYELILCSVQCILTLYQNLRTKVADAYIEMGLLLFSYFRKEQ